MSKKKRFSFEDDPSFSDFTEKDLEEWRKNAKQFELTPQAICSDCLNQIEDGGCDIYNPIEQRDAILRGYCDEHIT